MCRALDKQNLTRKKSRRSERSGTEENQRQRVEYWEEVREIEPENLVFLDEIGTAVGLARLYGRSLKGKRLYDLQSIYRGKNLTSVGAISLRGVLAFETLTKALNGEEFKKFLREKLIPELWNGAVLIMDNLSAHKVEGVEEMLGEVGVKVIYLSPYSPEFNPSEHL
jgi:hypothetical protein